MMVRVQMLDVILSCRGSVVADVERYATLEDICGTPLGRNAAVAYPIWLTVAIGRLLASSFYN